MEWRNSDAKYCFVSSRLENLGPGSDRNEELVTWMPSRGGKVVASRGTVRSPAPLEQRAMGTEEKTKPRPV